MNEPKPPTHEELLLKAESYRIAVDGAVWEAFTKTFQELAKTETIDYSLLNKATVGAFLDCAAKVAVDEGMHEDLLAKAIRDGVRGAYARAPRFG